MLKKQNLPHKNEWAATHLDRREDVGNGDAANNEEDAEADDADRPVEGTLDKHAGAERALLCGLLQERKARIYEQLSR